MTSACPMCAVVAALGNTDEYRPPDRPGGAYRRIAWLGAGVAVLPEDQFYRGYTLVISRSHATELHHLGSAEATIYLDDMRRTAEAIAKALAPRKLNYELLGNTVGHLHWHIFPRYADDPNPMRPVWEHSHTPHPLAPAEYATLALAIRRHLV